VTADEANADVKEHNAHPSATLMDGTGTIGHAYDAKTTPHMFVIDPAGKIIYEGAIDDHATTDVADVRSSQNYVTAALTESLGGKPVTTAFTRPYGCSVKYAN
jgi:hypothetical protein